MIYLCQLGFSSMEKLRTHIRELLKRIGKTNSVKITHNEYYNFLYEFCCRHPDKTKMQDVIDIQVEPEYDYFRMFIVKLGVSVPNTPKNCIIDDISLHKCVSGKKSSPAENFNKALRLSIIPQINHYKKSADLSKCELCECPFSETGKIIHIDHFQPQFHKIVAQFKQEFNPVLPLEYHHGKNGLLGFIESDKLIETEFYLYHKKVATYRVLCSNCNCSRKLDA